MWSGGFADIRLETDTHGMYCKVSRLQDGKGKFCLAGRLSPTSDGSSILTVSDG